MHPIVAPNKACEIFWAAVLYKLRVLNIYPFAVSKISFCFFFFKNSYLACNEMLFAMFETETG